MGVRDGDVVLWPCNEQAWSAWCSVQTQWRTGMGGQTVLDYAAVCVYLRQRLRLRGDDFDDVFDAIQAAERAILELRAEQHDMSAPPS